jgi:putative dehydrogenase
MDEKIMAKHSDKVGVIGLGNMGSAIAYNLIKDGFEVVGTDLVAENREALTKTGGTAVYGTQEVGKQCCYIILSLPTVDAIDAVTIDLAASCKQGTIVIETSTLPLTAKTKVRDLLAERGIVLLDAPLSGTGAQAKNKDLAVYASGDSNAIEAVVPIMKGFARAHYDLGEFGNGTKTKFVANQLVAIHNVAAAEAILLGIRYGLDPATLVEVIGAGAGSSRMLQVRGPSMVNRSWNEAMITNKVFQKDLKLIADGLQTVKCPAPLFAATLPIYTAAMASGHAEHDTAAVYEVLERMSQAPDDAGK